MHLKAINAGLEELKGVVQQEITPSRILYQIALYGAIYPFFVLLTNEERLMSRLTVTLQQKGLKTDNSICKNVLRRILFCIIQGLFIKVENIRGDAPKRSSDPTTEVADLLIIDVTPTYRLKNAHESGAVL